MIFNIPPRVITVFYNGIALRVNCCDYISLKISYKCKYRLTTEREALRSTALIIKNYAFYSARYSGFMAVNLTEYLVRPKGLTPHIRFIAALQKQNTEPRLRLYTPNPGCS